MPAAYDGADLAQDLASAFGLDRFRPGRDQAAGVGDGGFDGVIAAKGQVGRDQGAAAWPGPRRGRGVPYRPW